MVPTDIIPTALATRRSAPLVAVLLVEVPDDVPVFDPEEDDPVVGLEVVVADEPVVATRLPVPVEEGEALAPVAPLICDWTEALNWPVMLARVNLAEKASAGVFEPAAAPGTVPASETNLMK